jgi:hypothetical protein
VKTGVAEIPSCIVDRGLLSGFQNATPPGPLHLSVVPRVLVAPKRDKGLISCLGV